MKLHRPDMMAKLIAKYIRYAIHCHNNIIEIHRYKYNSNISSRDIVVTKVLPSRNIKSMNVFYVINNGNEIDRNFLNENKKIILSFLKQKIKLKKFPIVKFKLDKNYSLEIYQKMQSLYDSSSSQQAS